MKNEYYFLNGHRVTGYRNDALCIFAENTQDAKRKYIKIELEWVKNILLNEDVVLVERRDSSYAIVVQKPSNELFSYFIMNRDEEFYDEINLYLNQTDLNQNPLQKSLWYSTEKRAISNIPCEIDDDITLLMLIFNKHRNNIEFFNVHDPYGCTICITKEIVLEIPWLRVPYLKEVISIRDSQLSKFEFVDNALKQLPDEERLLLEVRD